MTRRLKLVGHQFGKLTVVSDEGNNRFGQSMWKCSCSCGGETVTSGVNLRNDHSQSCGCEQSKPAHGHTSNDARSLTYKTWASMTSRAARDEKYKKLGIDPSWTGRGGFERFMADIGERPSAAHTVDRIDGSRGYVPGNVRWATVAEQARNISTNVWVDVAGERLVARDAAQKYGLNYKTFLHRLKRMSPEEAVSTPVRQRGVV